MCYFSNPLEYPRITIDSICHALRDPKFGEIDTIVGTGLSGTLVLVPVFMQCGIRPCIIRKELDRTTSFYEGGSHSSLEIESHIPCYITVSRYVIIDDRSESGATIRRIICSMKKAHILSQCVGIILYQDSNKGSHDLNNIPITSLDDDILEIACMAR